MALIGSLAGSMIGSAGAGGVMQALGGGAAAISAARMVGGMAGGSMVNAITSRPQARSIPQPPAQPSRPTINYTPMLNSIISGLQGITVRIESSNAYLKQLVQLNSPATVNNYNNNVINRFVTALNGSILGRLTGKQYFEEFNRKYSDMMRHWGDQLEKKTVNNFELIAYKLMGNGSLLGRVFSGNAPFMDKMTKSLQSYGRSSSTFDNNTRTTIVDVIPRHLKTNADYTIVTANNTAKLIYGTKKASAEIEEQIKVINRSQKNNQSLLQNEFNSVKEEFRKSISISGAFFNIMRNHLTWIPKIGASILLFKGAGWLANQLGLTPLLKNFGTRLYSGAKSLVSGIFSSPVFKGALDRLGTTIVNGIYKALMWYASYQGAKRLASVAGGNFERFKEGMSVGALTAKQREIFNKKLQHDLGINQEEATLRMRKMTRGFMGTMGNIVGALTGSIGRFLTGLIGKIGAAMNTVTLAIQIGSLIVNSFRVLVSKAFNPDKKGPLNDADIVGYIVKKLYSFTSKFMQDLALAIGFVLRNAVPLLKGIVVGIFKSFMTFVANILYQTGIDVFKKMATSLAKTFNIPLGDVTSINKRSLDQQVRQTRILDRIREATDEMSERLNPKVLMGDIFRLLGSLHGAIGKMTSSLTKGKVDISQSMYGAATNITKMTGNANMGAAYLSRLYNIDSDVLRYAILQHQELGKGTTSGSIRSMTDIQNQKNQEVQQQNKDIGDAIDSNVGPERLRKIIEQALITVEGRKQSTYYDGNGFLTGGIGHKITQADRKLGYTKDKISLTDETINQWFANDFNRAYKLSSSYSIFNQLSDPRKAALIDLAFVGMLRKSPRAMEYLSANRISQAADEFLNSDAAKGKGGGKGLIPRMYRDAFAIKFNTFDTEYQDYKSKYLQNSRGTNTSKGAILNDIGKYLRLAPDLDNGSLTNLHPELLSRLYEYSKLYYEKHGKQVVLNSGFRTFAKQQQLYNDWKANKMPNTPNVAIPGSSSSKHEKGLAVDISNRHSPVDAALLKRVGLIRPVGGENWHVELGSNIKGTSPVNVTASTQNVGPGANIQGITQTSGGNDVFDNFINMFKIFTGVESPYESQGDPVDFTVSDVLSSVTNRIKNSMIGKESILFKGQAELASENNQEQGKLIGKHVAQPMEKMSEKIAQNLGSAVSTMAKTMISVGMPTINQIITNTNTSNISSSSVTSSQVSNGQESTSLDKIDNYDFGLSAFMI